MALLMQIDGSKQNVYPKDSKNGFSLQELYTLIGCRVIEAVGPLSDGRWMILDEEGKLNGQELNVEATELFYNECGRFDAIMGNVILADDKEFQ